MTELVVKPKPITKENFMLLLIGSIGTLNIFFSLSIFIDIMFTHLDNLKRKIYVIVGDGECYEGSIWESIMFASHHQLDNLCIIVDRNNQITLDFTEDCNALDPIDEKFSSFGLNIFKTPGHDHEQILNTFKKINIKKNSKPNLIIANTTKGKGVSFMENIPIWHYRSPNKEEYKIAIKEIDSAK